MRFVPKTENEIAAANLIADGTYPFEVIEAAEQTSKAGNDMIKLKIKVYAADSAYGVYDYLVDSEATAYKVRHFADSVGMLEQYEKGQLAAEDLIGCAGKCKIGTQPEKDGYPAKNVVRDYIKRDTKEARAAATPTKTATKKRAADDDMDDDIPF